MQSTRISPLHLHSLYEFFKEDLQWSAPENKLLVVKTLEEMHSSYEPLGLDSVLLGDVQPSL